MNKGAFLFSVVLEIVIFGVLSAHKDEKDKYSSQLLTSSKTEISHSLKESPDRRLIDKDLVQYEDSIDRPYIVDHEGHVNQESFASNEESIKSDSETNKDNEASMSWLKSPGFLAGIICTGLVIGLLLLLLAVFCIYRIRKRDEGSYALDEPKKMLPPSSEYSKAPTREFYA